MALINNLDKYMKLKNISGLRLFEISGISPGIISNLRNGKMIPYKGWKTRLAIALDVKPEELFPESEDVQ